MKRKLNESQMDELVKKCTKIRDKIIKEQIVDEKKILKLIKKKMNINELEELAMQFIIRETLNYVAEVSKEKDLYDDMYV
jgi:hypothetical protein